ncbi:MAG TPA: metallophosphoesterase family protein [Dehalococcoidia bacterium]|nr:metallophosphoesterase family protein [Dehalococcoidia bacterium]
MRYAILGDIHSNLAAFQAVLRDIDIRGGFDKIWCLGDVVGYGPDPHECIGLLCQCEHLCVAGNHDWAAIGKIDTSDFNPDAARACRWTGQQLTKEDIDYLQNLPLSLCQDDFTLVHGSPREPIWEYLLSIQAAQDNFAYFKTAFCLVGHSHVPLVFECIDNAAVYREFPNEANLTLGESRLIINPGGVGQPRDGDPRASYAIYDVEARIIYHYRVDYDIAVTQRKMEERGLPLPLILRLNYGW